MKKLLFTLLLFASIISADHVHASLGSPNKDSVSSKEEKAKEDFKSALSEFKSLSRHERKLRIKAAKKSF
jgi:hypothetical protein